MLGIGGAIDKRSEITHALKLLLETIQRPHIDGAMPLVDDFDGYRGLGCRRKDWVGNVTELI